MAKWKTSPETLFHVLIRIPEGFISRSILASRFRIDNRASKQVAQIAQAGRIGQVGDLYFDPARVSAEQVNLLKAWCRPQLPRMRDANTYIDRPIVDLLAARQAKLAEVEKQIVDALPPAGYAELASFTTGVDEAALQGLLTREILMQADGLIYDPLRLGPLTMQEVLLRRNLAPMFEQIVGYLKTCKGEVARFDVLCEHFEQSIVDRLVGQGQLLRFSLQWRKKGQLMSWVTPVEADIQRARRTASAESRVKDEEWQPLLEDCGKVLRPDAKDGTTNRQKVAARTYILTKAAARLGARPEIVEAAINAGDVFAFEDPQGHIRLPADDVETAYANPQYALHFTGREKVKPREIALVAGLTYAQARYRLQQEKLSTTAPRWEQVCGQWGLPEHLYEFKALLRDKKVEWREERRTAYVEEQSRLEQDRQHRIQAEKQMREELRARLLPIFPTWEHEGRENQRVIVHIGPPNSGKTHDALTALAEAGSGWYLAPLRLLAFEVFDRLNMNGVRCNLLTGEEYIPVDGATFTASTIEMFNAQYSGKCVIIDEAQMLADPDRGWAWTRALMEARAPEIHVIGPKAALNLVKTMAESVSMPVEIVEHQRLAPIKVADYPWSLSKLPKRTILVAFSRSMVLELKTRLETMRRKVSVVYGSLPPEVRRRQADRFAEGKTEICIATDAVGMGLNLPADYVCFFEVDKFDGRERRMLTPSEVQQIGGRAGRFGFSEAGEVGAMDKFGLTTVLRLFNAPVPHLTHARIAPSVEELELLPGTFAERLQEWARLQSIPDHLRSVLKTADMTERVELARMLQPDEVEQLGLKMALKLVNAPTRENTRTYWRRCATAILLDRQMPPPPLPPLEIRDSVDLDLTEESISHADVYLWLSQRPEFRNSGMEEGAVREARGEWSARIDAALLRRIEAARKCANCGKRLPKSHPYGICDDCYFNSRYFNGDENSDRVWIEEAADELEAWDASYFAAKADIPAPFATFNETRCPVCKHEVTTPGLARLAHWQKAHRDQVSLTVSQVAWMLGRNKADIQNIIKFDHRPHGFNGTRYWKLSTVEAFLRSPTPKLPLLTPPEWSEDTAE
ncbi:MAG: hypothetical protein HY862_18185 [Chloroflexi bacterium]|nr:hypothetical protein [Chloroflexota bacterium]